MKRVIFIEPQIEYSEVILDIFKKHNSDSSFINPHICLVFPFESDFETSILETIINSVFSKYSRFNIKLSGLSVSYEKRKNFLFLNVIDESNILGKMSSELYDSLGDNTQLRGKYIPHITLAKSKSKEKINQIYNDSRILLQSVCCATISNVYCKKLIKDSDGNTKLEDEIEFKLS